MADTPRSLSALQALLADNTSGDISPQDIRDFLVSSLGVYGSIYCVDAVTQQDNPDTGALLTCFTNNGNANGTTPDHTNDNITIDVAGNYDIYFQASFSGTSGSEFQFKLRKGGVEQNYGCTRTLGTGGDSGSASFLAPAVSLIVNDIVTIWVEADGATDDLTVKDAQFSVKMVG